MNLGIDIGYSSVKAVAGHDRFVSFPSVVGTPDTARFSINGTGGDILLHLGGDGSWLVGEGAVAQSRNVDRPEDREWIRSDAYRRLTLAAFTSMSAATQVEYSVVTGLPVAFYNDRDELRDLFLGTHSASREGRRSQVFKVTSCRVIPQPFGTLLAETLDNNGKIVDQELATGAIGLIDIGGKTTNLLSVNRLSEIARETASVNVGAWNAARAVREYLNNQCPGLEDLRDHQIVDAIISRRVRYYGEPVELGAVIDNTLAPMAAEISASCTQLWNGGATLDAILVTGGGALLIAPFLSKKFRHLRIVQRPVFANAEGYWKLAQRVS